ncbi:ABC transporter ATP-binding protein [Syntrophomonas palmitatica]|uniref:ABC transporter ATP-binding protein n=1 Tax=Syntrophomonas palmitatica TaxID=402877 RepID=UPI0006CFEE7F|nr:ABC transporter ATP-binding protein [Syntrophomonas palmitatica]
MHVIETNKLTKYYGQARGIIEVSFEVQEGEIFGFIGPNGAGKSTTIRTLLGLIYPTSGSAKIFGRDCIKEGPEIRRQIGYLPSEVYYYDNMKVIDLLKYSASFYPHTNSKRIYELAKIMDLDVNKKIDDLSYGSKKKVGIVQGLLHRPKLIILDEPTGGLDPLMQHRFFELIREENQNGVTVLFSSHILSEVQKICTRVGIIKEGSMVKIEDINELGQKNYKRFKVEMAEPVMADYFDLAGIESLSVHEKTVSFLYNGDINKIIAKLYTRKINNLIVEEPSLEEIFMHYYEKEA